MRNVKSRLFLGGALVLALCAPDRLAKAQSDSCVALSTSFHAYLDPAKGWIGQGWWVFGNSEVRYASEITGDTTYDHQSNVMSGTEKTTVDFGNGDTFQLMTRWIAHDVAGGVSEVHEVGSIANGTGKFSGVFGLYYTPGTAGPAMSGDGKTFLWLGVRQGLICGLKAAMTVSPSTTPVVNGAQAAPVPFRR
jgi:hypothetical protein